MSERASKALFFALALPSMIRAAARLILLQRRSELPDLVDRMRQVRPFRVSVLRNPRWLAGCATRVAPFLPPWDQGLCLKRSFMLLDLLSRCGLVPRIHFGAQKRDDGTFAGHAWITEETMGVDHGAWHEKDVWEA